MSNPSRSVENVFVRLNSPIPQTQPDRLATFARMRGLQPHAAESAAVLEIGCGAGRNLLPLADRYPQATFVGIDVSSSQIAVAQQWAAEAGLANVRFHCSPIDRFAAEGGTFDYIIAPDVYSWVDNATRESLFALCARCLAPQGVAYINYNVNPGWQLHIMLGTMMRFAASGAGTAEAQIGAARRMLQSVREMLPSDDDAYGSLMTATADGILTQSDAVLIRNYLQGPGHASYYSEFATDAARHRLQMLGEARQTIRPSEKLAPTDERRLAELSEDPARKETVRDLIFNTAHRQSMLCRAEVSIDPLMAPDRLNDLWLEGHFSSPDEEIEIEASATSTFVSASGGQMATTLPSMKVAIAYLGSIWPRRARYQDLVEVVREQVEGAGQSFTPDDQTRLAVRLLECCLEGLLDLHGEREPFAPSPGERPRASQLARQEAVRSDVVASRQQVPLRLELFDRYVLAQLDGTRDVRELVELLLLAATHGQIALVEQGQAIPADRARAFVEQELNASLARLAEHALLIE
jgi:SAM-dependent methyltransferase